MPKTVLYFLDDTSRDKHFHDYVLTGLEKAGYNPVVVYFWMGGKKSQLERMGHKIYDLGCTSESYKGFHPRLIQKIKKVIIKFNASAIHSQRHHPLIYMAAASCLTNISAFFYTVRSTKLIRNTNRRISFFFSSKKITKIIAVSNGVKEDFVKMSKISGKKVEVIPNGIDPSPFELHADKKQARQAFNLSETGFYFGMAARFKKAKDHFGLINAFADVKKKGVNTRLVLAGDGPLENDMKILAKSKGLENDVVFLGKISPGNIPLFLKTLDVFVHPSLREGMPAAVLEAMASGLPVIATDAEGISDIFDSKRVFGKMLPRGDTQLLADAMADFYDTGPENLEKMGIEATARIREAFTHTHMVDKTVALYDRFLQ